MRFIQITPEYTKVPSLNVFQPSSMRLQIGNEPHEWEGEFDVEKKKIMKAQAALKALMHTSYRFTVVPYNLGRGAQEIISRPPPERPPSSLARNAQYKINVNDPQYASHLVEWVELLAEQNKVRITCTDVLVLKLRLGKKLYWTSPAAGPRRNRGIFGRAQLAACT